MICGAQVSAAQHTHNCRRHAAVPLDDLFNAHSRLRAYTILLVLYAVRNE